MTEKTGTAETVETSEDAGQRDEPKAKAKTTKKTTKKTAKKRVKKKTDKKTAKKTTKKTAKKPVKKKPAPAEPDEAKADAPEQPEAEPATAEARVEPEAQAQTQAQGDADELASEPKPVKKRRSRRKKTSEKKATTEKAEQAKPATATAAAHDDEDDEDDGDDAQPKGPVCEMVINYSPGEECRIAILEDGQLEEFDSEPTEHVSRVGNIYVGKVVNIESQIQAAFVDFGVEEAGFLHISDLHPRYFPGADADETERVGRKTPRRERPPIQQALRRGQEITVQVLKEGVGTKGPTLTGYLSIPGRFLVMMPDMDRVGVSRKVEDEDERRKMRQVLDLLDLPDGFGFILRTAGMDRTKTELKRDLSYLQRLWKDMERRRMKGGGSRLLYSEADLLLRTIRDRTGNDVARIIVDNEAALRRSSAFMKIVSPRASTKLCQFQESRPVFHAFGIESQLDLMHATEVPLPSGGRLVIEQTEALVAIDVNSGKSRSARDAETNAYQTNLEAVDEICRQLRLRDLGGLVINDLIDMRHASHRKDIENRFRDRLKRDKARSTILPISQFGILEMTRQRMRGSFEQQHFQTCPRCTGRGLIQRPDSVAAGALRDLAALLEHDRVQRVELVVSPLVAGALLSTRRSTLGRIERFSGKNVDVRVSETISASRVMMYAYSGDGADIDIDRLPRTRTRPDVMEWEDTDLAPATDSWAVDLEDEAELVRAELESEAQAHEQAVHDKIAHLELPGDEAEPTGKKKRRRRKRRRKSDGDPDGQSNGQINNQSSNQPDNQPAQPAREQPGVAAPGGSRPDEPRPSADAGSDSAPPEADGDPKKKRRRRRRRRGKGDGESSTPDGAPSTQAEHKPAPQAEKKPEPRPQTPTQDAEPKPVKRKRRTLYGSSRRSLGPSERTGPERD